MKLSKDTIAKLKNFASINPNVVYDGNGKLKTISEAKNILAETNIESKSDGLNGFSIYDLNEFLSVVSLIDNGDITFNDNECIIKNGSQKVRYVFADPNILTTPQKDITMPPSDYTFNLKQEDIDTIRKAASTLGHNTLRVKMANQSGDITVVDSTGASKNDFTLREIESPTTKESVSFSFDILINNLKLMNGDYTIHLSEKLISKWEGTNANYYIALESTSSFTNT
tara:strand:+ start:592 stop:1272 length:681 start_codon:yes stop_codon:yes gene_type:complete